MHDPLGPTALAEATHFWFRGFRSYVAPVLREIAGSRRDLRIIDCGCGTGYNLTHLLQPYGRPFGFDLAPSALSRARGTGRPVVRASIGRIPFASNTFDLATSFDVLQSVPDDRAALREIARVVKPGGHVLLNTAAFEWLRGDHSDVWVEVHRYTPAQAAAVVSAAGLQVVRTRLLFASLVPMILAVRSAQRLLRTVRDPQGDADMAVPARPINAALSWMVRGEAALARHVPLPIGSSLLIVARKAS